MHLLRFTFHEVWLIAATATDGTHASTGAEIRHRVIGVSPRHPGSTYNVKYDDENQYTAKRLDACYVHEQVRGLASQTFSHGVASFVGQRHNTMRWPPATSV